MITATYSASSGTFFYPDQFAARPALAALADVARSHGQLIDAEPLAHALGMPLSGRLGVQDLVRAGELLGLPSSIRQCAVTDLLDINLPALLFVAHPSGEQGVLVLAQFDGKYIAMRDHGSMVPRSTMGPVRQLTEVWSPQGDGWLMEFLSVSGQ
jgi:ABC-type bacteriocin/lantibiotic exporter with double-glycine peptidase domain